MPHHNIIWQSDFNTTDWLESWNTNQAPQRGITFGEENISVENDGTRPEGSFLRIRYPQGSWSPNATKKARLPVGGAQFYGAVLNGRDITDVTLKYSIRFPKQFKWVKGGKLPGLYPGFLTKILKPL